VLLFEVGEFAIVVSTSLKNKSMMTNILEFWFENNSFQVKKNFYKKNCIVLLRVKIMTINFTKIPTKIATFKKIV